MVVIYLAALAGGFGLEFDFNRLNELSETTPVLVDLKPTGLHYMEDLAAAGGIPAVMRELGSLLHLDFETITGETVGAPLESSGQRLDRPAMPRNKNPIQ